MMETITYEELESKSQINVGDLIISASRSEAEDLFWVSLIIKKTDGGYLRAMEYVTDIEGEFQRISPKTSFCFDRSEYVHYRVASLNKIKELANAKGK